jgi:hypothetical protein
VNNKERLARKAYAAYGGVTNFKNYQGLPMPEFDALTPAIKAAWCAASLAVRESTIEECAGALLARKDTP